MSVIHSFTEPTPERGSPAYVSVDRNADGTHSITVRSREEFLIGCHIPAKIEMTPKQLATMALDILDYFNGLAQPRK